MNFPVAILYSPRGEGKIPPKFHFIPPKFHFVPTMVGDFRPVSMGRPFGTICHIMDPNV